MTGAGTLKTHYSGQTPRRGRQSTAGQNNILYKVIMIFNLIMTMLSTLVGFIPRETAPPAFGFWRYLFYFGCIFEYILVAVFCLVVSCIVECLTWSKEMSKLSKAAGMTQTIVVNVTLLLAGVAYLVGDNIRMLTQDFDAELLLLDSLKARDFRSYVVAFSLYLMVISRLELYIANAIADYMKPQSVMTLIAKFEKYSNIDEFWLQEAVYTLSIPSGYYKMWKLGTTLNLSFQNICRQEQNLQAESNILGVSQSTSTTLAVDSTAWEQNPLSSPGPTWTVILQDEGGGAIIKILYFGSPPKFVQESTILAVNIIDKSKNPEQIILIGHSPKITVADNLCTWQMEFQTALEKHESQNECSSPQEVESRGSLLPEGEPQGSLLQKSEPQVSSPQKVESGGSLLPEGETQGSSPQEVESRGSLLPEGEPQGSLLQKSEPQVSSPQKVESGGSLLPEGETQGSSPQEGKLQDLSSDSSPQEGESQRNSQTIESLGNSESTKVTNFFPEIPVPPMHAHSGTSIMKYSKISSYGLLWAYVSLFDYALIADAFYTTILDELKQNYKECFDMSSNATVTRSEFDLRRNISLAILVLMISSWAIVILWIALRVCCCHKYQRLAHLEDFLAIVKTVLSNVSVFVRRVNSKITPEMQKIVNKNERPADHFMEHKKKLLIGIIFGIFVLGPAIHLYMIFHGAFWFLVGGTITYIAHRFFQRFCDHLVKYIYSMTPTNRQKCCNQDCKLQAATVCTEFIFIVLILFYLPVYLVADNSWPWECLTDQWTIIRIILLFIAFMMSLPFTGLALIGKAYSWLDGQVKKKDLYKVGIGISTA
jgi:hypothetical protein